MSCPDETLTHFASLYDGVVLESTDCEVVDYGGVLYNVRGSSDDPNLGGSWRGLLIRHGISGSCYVTEPAPDPSESTHPEFALGGHMTPNANGFVPTGETCYLMPLCHWHNSTGRDGMPFKHRQTRMLRLLGYMQDDTYASFAARLPGNVAGRIVRVEGDHLVVSDLDSLQLQAIEVSDKAETTTPQLLFRRIEQDDRIQFRLEFSHSPPRTPPLAEGPPGCG